MPMLFAFDYHDTRGDVQIAPYEGVARIERCDVNGWQIAGIDLDGWKPGVGDMTIALAKDDPLYTRIALHLQQTKHVEIGGAWDWYVREQRAEREPA